MRKLGFSAACVLVATLLFGCSKLTQSEKDLIAKRQIAPILEVGSSVSIDGLNGSVDVMILSDLSRKVTFRGGIQEFEVRKVNWSKPESSDPVSFVESGYYNGGFGSTEGPRLRVVYGEFTRIFSNQRELKIHLDLMRASSFYEIKNLSDNVLGGYNLDLNRNQISILLFRAEVGV